MVEMTLEDALATAAERHSKGDTETAIAIMRQLLTACPNFAPAQHGLVVMLAGKGETAEAVVLMFLATRMTRDPMILTQLLRLLNDVKAHVNLIDACEEFQDIFGEAPYVLNLWGHTLNGLSRFAEALPLLERARIASPGNPLILHNLSSSL